MRKEEIIKQYLLSVKSQKQQETARVYTFLVHPQANKFQIKAFLEDTFGVKVKKIRTSCQKPVLQKVSLLRKFPGKFYTKLKGGFAKLIYF